jgi:hypothetical protein
LDEWSETGHCCGGDAQTRFDGRPDGDVGVGVEEVGGLGELIDVGDADYGCYGAASEIVSAAYRRKGREDYSAPRDRIRATEILVRRFMFRFQTRGIGSVQSVKSEHMFIAPCVYVEPAIMTDATHEPDSPANCVQK